MPAEAGDEPSAEDAPTEAAAAAGVVPHLLMILIESTSTGGDGRGGSYVAADIKSSRQFKVRYAASLYVHHDRLSYRS